MNWRTVFNKTSWIGLGLFFILSADTPGQSDREARLIVKKEQELSRASETKVAAFQELQKAYLAAKENFSGPPEDFNFWWNETGYLRSSAAKAYTKANGKLENAFMVLEKLRHPERFQKGYSQTPLEMAFIPGGRYLFGPHSGSLEGFHTSKQAKEVRVKPFYIDRQEVTVSAYKEFLRALPPSLRAQHLPQHWILDIDSLPIPPEGTDNFPVTFVSWESAHTYARWQGKRLPTEVEWETAARGKEGRPYPFGDTMVSGKIHCKESANQGPAESSKFPADKTPLGVLGLAGNVREWTADLYFLPGKGARARLLKSPRPGAVAISRGGSFRDPASACTSTFRWAYPIFGTELPHLGFRCARDLD
jgi:sulfatase modifying factor 1